MAEQKKICKMKKHQEKYRGFTLLELLIVLAIVVLLAGVALPTYMNSKSKAQAAVDRASIRTLNSATSVYKYTYGKTTGDIFEGLLSDEERMQELVDKGLINKPILPLQPDTVFRWTVLSQAWMAYVGEEPIPLSPLGSTFSEISTAMIDRILQKYADDGNYGRTWGDYRYTDIGLDPQDWNEPILHIIYTPSGSTVRIKPEDGYRFIVEDYVGATRVLTSSSNWNLLYDVKTETWYYHSISASNVIDINSLEIAN
ncbi:MAG: prepilin-type N-terminal cleavage/methylation domain-containing protein [Clostridia bacterium]|nr:prepilin-type N-terminal cleavage/methylation domain-containing protein [Clostridia bacterium]